MEKIKIENLTFTYPQNHVPSLDRVNASINSGEFVVVCGKSGCGKSTLLKNLKPIISPHGEFLGNVLFDGKNIKELTQREQSEKIGFVMQNPDNQIVCDKVWHELVFGLESLAYTKTEIRARAAETASFFGIQNWFYKNVRELSGGQKQLLNLASVMIMQPEVLLLDEPTSQLDPIAAHDFLETVYRINRELGTTVVLSEHRLEEAIPLADKVIVMEKGGVSASGTPREIGEILKNSGSDMLEAMPTPMRIYYSAGKNSQCPVTVREGKKWLEEMNINTSVNPCISKTPEIGRTALELKDIWFRYEKELPDILKGLSFKVNEGELYAILGGNGTGKTTALSVITGINKPYRGKLAVPRGKKIAALPQNPQNLFSRKTVLADLEEVADELNLNGAEREKILSYVIGFCELGNLLQSHPYDLSGGEQQRAALALVLLTKPDILILDEPTKGMDSHFKKKLAGLVKSMLKGGMTVVMVSHDIEFCAKYADRCAMFFDGRIVSENSPREFFDGKSFYTTASNRMARTTVKGAVLDTDIISALGVDVRTDSDNDSFGINNTLEERKPEENEKSRKITAKNIICGLVFAAAFLTVQFFHYGKYGTLKDCVIQILGIVFLAAACVNLIPQKEFEIKSVRTQKSEKSIKTVLSAVVILLMIPAAIFVGIRYLHDKKYYFISLLIILETMLAFALSFEGRKPQTGEIVIISVLCALTVAGRAAFAPLPEFKPVIAMVIISAVCFGSETGFLVGAVTGFVSNFFFGQGPWTPWQMFSFGIIGYFAGVLFQKGILRKTKTALCIFGFFAALVIYGGIMNPASVIMTYPKPGIKLILASYIPGFPVDLVHAVSTVFFLWFAAEPMCEKLERVKTKYDFEK